MKIGKFAEYNNISKDTIRHYMDLGLIVPEKKSGQYDFDERCQQILEEIMALKNMDFTLNDIKNISRMQSLGQYSDYQKHNHYQKLFQDQYAKVTEEIDHLISER